MLGTFCRLLERLQPALGSEEATPLAGAITNWLFMQPGKDAAQQTRMLVDNRALVDAVLQTLVADQGTQKALSQAIWVHGTLQEAGGQARGDALVAHVADLGSRGVFAPGTESPSPDTFIPMAYAFRDASPRPR
jgi:hypothetical protein